jgi:hypothetical protein
MISVNNEFGKFWKQEIVSCFDVPSWHLPEENKEKEQIILKY